MSRTGTRTFFLSTEVPVELKAVRGAPPDRWMPIPHSGIARPAYVMLAGETALLIPKLHPDRNSKLLVRYGAAHPNLSTDGATLLLAVQPDGGPLTLLATATVAAGAEGLEPREIQLDLGAWSDRVCRLLAMIGPGPENDPAGDWVALYEVVVAPVEELPLVRSRAFREERTRNELAHFATVYDHSMYQSIIPAQQRDLASRALSELLAESGTAAKTHLAESWTFDDTPHPGRRDPYHYSHDLLARALGLRPPDFAARARALAHRLGRPLRILSLCCGAARIEAGIARQTAVDIQWTLMDLNPQLLQSAAANFPADSSVELVTGDLNELADYGERYDVIVCVSGLHHIVELERVIGFARDVLIEGGEFWSIGEAIGRNGNRLWAADYDAANAFFRSLPDRLRHNRASGSVDADLPDADYSSGTFEGIRSEDIEPLLSRMLEPVELYRRNCFLWRVVNLAYADNYDMDDQGDRAFLQAAVRAELERFRAGGRPSELHGVYRRA